MEEKKIAVIGLGLIGGSLAMALRGFEGYEILGVDTSGETLAFARENGVADRVLAEAEPALAEAELVFLCLHPEEILRFLRDHAGAFRPGAVVTDVCGVKTAIVKGASVLPPTVEFLGGHPMAGKESGGIQNASRDLFAGAHYLITPDESTRQSTLTLMERVAARLGCRDLIKTTPERHDEMIAYTSQIMHVMAAALCDDPELFQYSGFEGGSFRDCTRVAALDVSLWTQLFSLNAEALCAVLARLEGSLRSYRETIAAGDRDGLTRKLTFSSGRKREMNRRQSRKKETE